MPLIKEILHKLPTDVSVVSVRVDRHTLSHRRWRANAANDTDFAVDLEVPCKHGDALWADEKALFVVEQVEEKVLEVLIPLAPAEAAQLGWFFGNQHLPVDVGENWIRVAFNQQLADLLDRNSIGYVKKTTVFCPPAHSSGPSHSHHNSSHVHS